MNIYIAMPMTDVTDTFITSRSLAALKEQGNVTRNMTKEQLTADELVEQAQDADVIVCGWGTLKFNKELIARLPNLKIIAYTAGSMAFVLEEGALDGSNVVALTGNYIFAKSVAEGCLAYILCSLRKLEENMKLMREGSWKPLVYSNRGIFGKKIGLIGFGQIAKNLVALLKPFEVEILVCSNHLTEEVAAQYGVTKTTREEIFSTCDIVSLHLALSEKTVGTIDRSLMSLLKPDALLVNTARGAIVDEEAMTELLAQKRFYAAIDVYSEEPPRADWELRKLENAVLIPHMGGPTIDMREYIVMSFAKDLEAFRQNKEMKNLFDVAELSHMTK